MKVTVQGHHLDIGEALQNYVSEKMNALNEKFFNRAVSATVTISKETHHLFKAQISMTVGKDIMVQATASEHDVHQAFDLASEKIAKQLRRYKRRLRDHHERMESSEQTRGLEYTMGFGVGDRELEEFADDELPEGHDEAVVVAEMATNIQTMTVSDAVMRLSLSGRNALMFRNASHGELNMVYKREDGNIGWIDPGDVASATSKVA